MTERRCAGCWQTKDRNEMIRITKVGGKLVIKPNSKTFGRSVYLCYNKSCIINAMKKNKLEKFLKAPISEELKGKLVEYQ